MEVRRVEEIVRTLNLDAKVFCLEPYWKWVRSKSDNGDLTFLEKLEWLEKAETLYLRLRVGREKAKSKNGKLKVGR